MERWGRGKRGGGRGGLMEGRDKVALVAVAGVAVVSARNKKKNETN